MRSARISLCCFCGRDPGQEAKVFQILVLVFFFPALTVKITFFETINVGRGECDVKDRNKCKHFQIHANAQYFQIASFFKAGKSEGSKVKTATLNLVGIK